MCTDENLIEMVRSHVVLYDLTHKKYMDSPFKDNIGNSIGQEIQITSTSSKLSL